MNARFYPALVLLGSVVCFTGCGPGAPAFHPVSGTVKLAGGQPAGRCTVEFASQAEATKGLNARGEVQADGTYKLTTTWNGKEMPGAVAGLHKVVVVPPPASSSGGPPPPPVPPRYAEYSKSGLTFEVKPGQENRFPIALEAR